MNLVAEEKEVGQTLLAVGTRGLSAPKRVLLGSVSTETLRAADGSVLIVPSESERTSTRDRAMVQGANGA
jgi:nucleotide-binding universal stress UspA family protein